MYRRWIRTLAVSLLPASLFAAGGCTAPQQFAQLGNFALQNGKTIQNLRLGYRICGQLKPDGSNAILFPAWFTGRSEQLLGLAGDQALVSDKRYAIVFIDPIADGVSTSPSNSASQPRMQFPRFTMEDMVHAEHRLATRVLHLPHVRAVMGISMGGMQTFQWMVSYPRYMSMAIPIVGSPRLTAFDRMLWSTEIGVIRQTPGWNNGNYQSSLNLSLLDQIHNMFLRTPAWYATHPFTPTPQAHKVFDANDWIRQAQAMLSLNVGGPYGNHLAGAAERVKARLLIVPSKQDHMVNPLPAERFANLTHARVLLLTSDCGHLANGCQQPLIRAAVARFLATPPKK